VTDDSEDFERGILESANAMAEDDALRKLALDTTFQADRYGYTYFWKWLGLPIIQMPDDIVAMQEIIWATKPQVIIETGFARGGSAVLYSSMLTLLGDGHVVSVDIDIREHNRRAVEDHPVGSRVRFVEGPSTAPETLQLVRGLVPNDARVMVVLDSNHTHEHVLEELRAYGELVTEGQYLVVSDTVVDEIPRQTHRPRAWGPGNNPKTAVQEFLQRNTRFQADPWFNKKLLMTSSRGGYLRCLEP
jgi:cephalosporin hydroxylase